jgi:hypothetical protein
MNELDLFWSVKKKLADRIQMSVYHVRGCQDELFYRFINIMLVTLALCGGPSVQ